LAELLERANADALLFPPGTACAYSNIGYAYVRGEIEEQMGADLDTAMRALLFGPLGVGDVRIARTRADMAAIYWPGLRGYDPGWVYHGLAIGTPLAAAQLLHRLMTTDFLPQELRAQMFRGTPVEPQDGVFANPNIGTGIMIGTAPGLGLCAGHSGAGPGSVCAVYHFPDRACTAAAFVEGEDQGAVERAVLQLAAAA
jgi:CubicO group peptidase (beta-lactamase class C family)